MKTMLIDAGKCIDCRNCQIACKDEHCDNDWSPIAAPQSAGQFWIKVLNDEAGDGTRVKMQRVPLLCQHCADPACLKACAHGAVYRREDGLVIIDPLKCQGCGACQQACAYGVIYENAERGIFQKCTMCAHLRDAGCDPRCVTACPSDALRMVESDEFEAAYDFAVPLEELHAEFGYRPQVRYQNLPRPFIAGEACTADRETCVAGAHVRAVHQVTGFVCEAVTDAFGDFWLEGLEPGFYTVTFEKGGFTRKTLANMDARESVNVGEVRLYREG